MRSIRSRRPASARARGPRVARACEWLLFGVGGSCLLVYAVACAHGSFLGSRDEAAFESMLVAAMHAESHDYSAWSEARRRGYTAVVSEPVSPLGRLEIPEASVSVMLLEGTDDLTLNRAVGHIEGTAWPGEHGNVGIAGHRDSFFRGLRHLEVGDDVSLTTLEGVAHYEVAKLEVVEPTEVEVLAPTDHEALTLVTCYPFYYVGDAPQRFIVHAQQVRFEPWSR